MVSFVVRDARPHPEERACRRRSANAKPRARVSKDGDERLGLPSCFETHRSALRLWKHLRSPRTATLLSMRARGRGAFWRNEANRRFGETNPTIHLGTHDHRRWLWVPALGTLGRDDDRLVRAKDQPPAVRNGGRRRFPVSGLFFTGNGATATCRGRGGALVAPSS